MAAREYPLWNAAYQYYQQGVLDADTWDALDRGARHFLDKEAYRGYWERNRDIWIAGFIAYIDGIIEQGG